MVDEGLPQQLLGLKNDDQVLDLKTDELHAAFKGLQERVQIDFVALRRDDKNVSERICAVKGFIRSSGSAVLGGLAGLDPRDLVGCQVRLCGLSAGARSGRAGIVVSSDVEAGRYGVSLEGGGSSSTSPTWTTAWAGRR